MSGSTLDPANFPLGKDRTLGRGHGTGALGPSDSSDSGSDVCGGEGLGPEGLIPGVDEESGRVAHGAGPDLGDADLDSDSDAGGTGERAAAGRDNTAPDGADIDVDHIETIPTALLELEEALATGRLRR